MRHKKHLLSVAIVGVIGLMPALAHAQYRTNSDGHARDVNNRVGSGGYNNAVNQSGQVTGNDVVNRDVTGLFGFQGRIPYGDPTQFTGRLPNDPSLALLQASGNQGPSAQPNLGPQPFYDISRHGTNVPPGYVQVYGTGTYAPAPPPTMLPSDTRLGNPLDIPNITLPAPGQYSGAGPVDPSANVTPDYVITNNSPLYGFRNLQLGGEGSGTFSSTPTVSNEGAYGQQLSPDDIMRYRMELNRNLVAPAVGYPNSQTPETSQQPINTGSQTGNSSNNAVPTLGAKPLATPVLGAKPLPPVDLNRSTLLSSPLLHSPLSNGASTGQISRQTILPPPAPAAATPEYAALREQLEKYNAMHPRSQEEADRIFQEELRLRRAYENPQNGSPPGPGQVTPPATPGRTNTGGAPLPPVEIGPVSEGVKAPGLHDLVKQGEDLAAHQQFKEAIDKFREALAVAPGNGLIMIDMADAELGAGYYLQAEQDIRDAFSSNPELLMAKYDLKDLIGDDRLQALIGDLKQLASKPDAVTPVVLLAYLSYNLGDAQKAVEYLNLAETRANGQDPLIRQLKDHWALPATQPAADFNK